MTVHGLLAADLALNTIHNEVKYGPWDAVVPSRHDMLVSMPLTWPESLQLLLPTAAKRLLEKQRKKFDKDWTIVSGAFPFSTDDGLVPSCTREEYMYTWLLVNTRTFYFITPQTKRLPKEDHMALQPVADLFNHTDKGGCDVEFDDNSTYSFRASRAYEKGEEVHISYGRHSNDFLLIEYGFVLVSNIWDEMSLDDAIMTSPKLSKKLKDELEDARYLGNYVLDQSKECHRTQVVMRLLLTEKSNGMTLGQWRRFVNGLDDGAWSQSMTDEMLVWHLKRYSAVVSATMHELHNLKLDDPATAAMDQSRRDMILRRWEQIKAFLETAMERLK